MNLYGTYIYIPSAVAVKFQKSLWCSSTLTVSGAAAGVWAAPAADVAAARMRAALAPTHPNQ